MSNTSVLASLEKHTPHLESQMPYGYRFKGIDVYHVTTKDRIDLDLYNELEETHEQIASVDVPHNTPHMKRIMYEIAKHIEGNYGCPFNAIIVERTGYITIHVEKDHEWWIRSRIDYGQSMSEYFMGLRSLLDLLK